MGLRIGFVFLALLSILSSLQGVDLSQEQRGWLTKNAPIKLGSTDNWAPFDMRDTNGELVGINADFLKELSSEIGVSVEAYISPTWDDVIKDAKAGKSHGVSAIPLAKEYEKDFIFTESYAKNPIVFIAKESAFFRDKNEIKSVATVRGNDFSQDLTPSQQESIKYFDTTLEAFQSVLNGDSDAYIGWLADAQYLMVQNSIRGLKVALHIESEQANLRFAITKQNRVLFEILNKALANISIQKRNEINSRWLQNDFGVKKYPGLELNFAESSWLAKNEVIKYAIDPDWMPIERINKDGLHEGISADILDIISSRSGIKFELVPTKKWNDSVELSKNGKVDMLVSVSKTSERDKYLNFSNSHLTLSDAVVVRQENGLIQDLDNLTGKKIGIKFGNKAHQYITTNHPNLILTAVPSTVKGLEAVSNGELDAYVDNLYVMGYLINNQGYFNLKVAYKLPEQRELHIALTKNLPAETLSIINKSLATFSETDRSDILKKWISIKVEEEVDYTLLWQILGISLIVVSVTLYWSMRLRKLNKKLHESSLELQKAYGEVDEKRRIISESIEFASLIQHSLLPDNKRIREYFGEYFTIWHPRDVVGGDIYLFEELGDSGDECILMLIDCTGHGVPGAFVTMLVKAIERQIIANINIEKEEIDPGKILSIFNKSIKHLLKQDGSQEVISNAGFDGGVLYYDRARGIIRYAGANTPLFVASQGKISILKGNKHSIGYVKSDANYKFHTYELDATKPLKLFLSSDGLLDQIGGVKEFPYGKSRFKDILEENLEYGMADIQEVVMESLKDYQGKNERLDDVTVIGLKIN